MERVSCKRIYTSVRCLYLFSPCASSLRSPFIGSVHKHYQLLMLRGTVVPSVNSPARDVNILHMVEQRFTARFSARSSGRICWLGASFLEDVPVWSAVAVSSNDVEVSLNVWADGNIMNDVYRTAFLRVEASNTHKAFPTSALPLRNSHHG